MTHVARVRESYDGANGGVDLLCGNCNCPITEGQEYFRTSGEFQHVTGIHVECAPLQWRREGGPDPRDLNPEFKAEVRALQEAQAEQERVALRDAWEETMKGLADEMRLEALDRRAEEIAGLRGDLKHGRHGVKAPLAWIPMWALPGTARVFDYGARKYRPGNWQQAAQDGAEGFFDYLSAALRHWAAIQQSDEGGVAAWASLDAESGLPHVDHLICSLLMLRGCMVLSGELPADPGRGNEPEGAR